MRFETSQHIRMGQQMKLAPRMIQSMEILQLPALELQERIDQELERNPVLELAEPEAPDASEAPEGAERGAAEEETDAAPERPAPLEVGESGADFERARELERAYGDFLDTESAPRREERRDDGERDRKMDAMANTPDRAEGLAESLLRQWLLAEVPPEVAAAGRLLIEYVDQDGLLGADLPTIAMQASDRPDGPWTEARLAAVLPVVQAFLEPPGILARDRRESLSIQLQARLAGVPEPVPEEELQAWRDAVRLVADHFMDLLANRVPHIQEASGLSVARINAAKGVLRRLSLNPGRELVVREERPIVPDVVVEHDAEHDTYAATLADGTVPPLRIAEQYQKLLKDRKTDRGTRDFLSDRLRSAQWLIDAVQQRQSTLLRVVNAVIARQREWFDLGPEHLKPLPMGDVADQLGIHVATVSRAVAGKWMATPRGLVELRRFFTGGLETADGGGMSFEAVRTLLREVVEGEDKSRPLSDEAIATRLRERGVEIARRTVVKYREQLGIPAARLRRVHA